MTTYVYKCDLCEHVAEIKQNMSDKPIETCPSCGVMGKEYFKRIIQPSNFILKGNNWYKKSGGY